MIQKTKLFLSYCMASLAFIALSVAFSSCSDDDVNTDPTKPTIEITSSNDFNANGAIEIQSRQLLNFEVEVTTPAIFEVLRLSATLDGAPADLPIDTEYTSDDVSLNPDETKAELTIVLRTDVSFEGEWVFTFEAEDKEEQRTTEEVTVLVTPRSLKVNKFTNITLESPADPQDENAKAFFSTNIGERRSMAEILSTSQYDDIDFGFNFIIDQNNNRISSPSEYPIKFGQTEWSLTNMTRLNLSNLTDSEFDNIDPTSDEAVSIIESAYDEVAGSFYQHLLIDGDVLAFETDPEKEGGSFIGLIKIIKEADDDQNPPYVTEIDVLVLAPKD